MLMRRHRDEADSTPEKGLEEMTVAELRDHAKANGIDLDGASRKADILAAIVGEE